MNIDELILKLSRIRAERGNLTVLVYDGGDPSDLEPVRRIQTDLKTFWESDSECLASYFFTGETVERDAVSLLTG